MKFLLSLLIAFGAAATAATAPTLPSLNAFFSLASMEAQCRVTGYPAEASLEAYRQHTIAYYQAGAPGTTLAKPDIDGALQALAGPVPASYLERSSEAAKKSSAAQLKMACQNMGRMLDTQISIEKLTLMELNAGK